jgi:hypothetical protein
MGVGLLGLPLLLLTYFCCCTSLLLLLAAGRPRRFRGAYSWWIAATEQA